MQSLNGRIVVTSDIEDVGLGSFLLLQPRRFVRLEKLGYCAVGIILVAEDPGVGRAGLNTRRQFADAGSVITERTLLDNAHVAHRRVVA